MLRTIRNKWGKTQTARLPTSLFGSTDNTTCAVRYHVALRCVASTRILHTQISISLSLSIYIYIYVCVCIYIYIYIYIYIHNMYEWPGCDGRLWNSGWNWQARKKGWSSGKNVNRGIDQLWFNSST